MPTILVAEDEPEVRNYLSLALSCHGYTVEFAQNGDEVITCLANDHRSEISALLLDIIMPCKDGLSTLSDVRRIRPELPVIMLSGASSPLNIVNAMKHGAADFLPKPISADTLRKAIEKVLPAAHLPVAPKSILEEPQEEYAPVTGAWSKKVELLTQTVGSSDVPVLLQGETGVGKEILARKLHMRSRRAQKPFLKLNCAALPAELVESELFGYERGAFTGAVKSTPGKFEMANGGTILLDEIGDMDFRLQAKLLQVLQDHEFLRLGAKETSKVDVRVMAATHCDLETAIVERRFREDLFYRLNIIDVHIPPLRNRSDEIIPLAEFFLKKHAVVGLPALTLNPIVKRALLDHDWPGNIRELENVMRKFLVLRNPDLLVEDIQHKRRRFDKSHSTRKLAAEIGTANLPPSHNRQDDDQSHAPTGEALMDAIKLIPLTEQPVSGHSYATDHGHGRGSILRTVDSAKKTVETEAIVSALNATLWNRKRAAVLLNIDYKALLYKMKKLGIGEKSTGDPSVEQGYRGMAHVSGA